MEVMFLKGNKAEGNIAFILFAFFITVYLFTASVLNFYHIDAGKLHIEVTRSLIERFDLSVPEGVGMRGADGRYYSWLGIGFALLATPFYLLGKSTGAPENFLFAISSVINQIVGAATVVLIFLFVIRLGYSKRASILVSVIYGLATIAWPLSKQPFDHVVETFFVLLSVYFMYRYILNKKALFLLLSGTCLGIAFITRLTSILVIPPLFIMVIVYYLNRHDLKKTARMTVRDILLFASAFLPFMALNLWYNYYRFDSIFETGYSLMAKRMGINFFANTLLTGLSGFLMSPGKGFFYYSPVAILFFFSIKPFIKKHLYLGISFILIMLSYLLFLSKYVIWHGDWAWGPRYLLVIMPFLIIPIAALFESDIWVKKNLLKATIGSIIVVSFIIQLAAISIDFNKYFVTLKSMEKVRFIDVRADGIQPIVELPVETYFTWQSSPILAQFRSVYEIGKGVKDYKYLKPPNNATPDDKYRAHPVFNVFDFWWLYIYFLEDNRSGFSVALLLLLMAIYYASRLWLILH
jgi:4-amino-4-deoxy-L-arabinose transferase-like glycosyltransferase